MSAHLRTAHQRGWAITVLSLGIALLLTFILEQSATAPSHCSPRGGSLGQHHDMQRNNITKYILFPQITLEQRSLHLIMRHFIAVSLVLLATSASARSDDHISRSMLIVSSLDVPKHPAYRHRRDVLAYTGGPAAGFPPFSCDKNLAVSPYLLSPPAVVNGQICFTVSVVTPTLKSPCNTMDFYKLIIEVGEHR